MKKIICLLLYVCILKISFSQVLPDVTGEFEKIIGETRSRNLSLNQKWPVNLQTFLADYKYLSSINRSPIDKLFNIYYMNLTSWINTKARYEYILGTYKTGAIGDIKNTTFKKYTQKNGGKVIYKGKIYTVEQLGNINFGIACKAIGIPQIITTCAAGAYQVFAQQNINPSTDGLRGFLAAIKSAVGNNQMRGACFDYTGDTQMIKMGFNWY